MSKNSFRPLADFPHAGELLLAIRSLSHRFPGQGRHVFLTASTNGPDVEILTMKYGAIPVPDIRRLYPRDQVPESELHAMQYLHRKLGWHFHESAATVPNSSLFMEMVYPPTREETRKARLQIRSELGLEADDAGDPTRMVSAESLFPIRVPAPPAPRVKMPPPIEPRDRDFALGDIAYMWWRDIEAAKKHFHSAARRGHPKAQHRLATIYSEERAYSVAIKWCRLAAWQGRLPEAQYDLACMYYHGRGVTQDLREAARWMLQAAEGANVAAMYGMGILCSDPVQAYAWLKLAALRKSADATKASRDLRQSMTDEQVLQAKTLMEKMRTSIHPPSKRSAKPKPGTKHYVGSQEVSGSVCEWLVECSVQRFGDDRWFLYLSGEDGAIERDGPMYPDTLVETVEQRGLNLQKFLSQLLGSNQPALRALAQEIGGESERKRNDLR